MLDLFFITEVLSFYINNIHTNIAWELCTIGYELSLYFTNVLNYIDAVYSSFILKSFFIGVYIYTQTCWYISVFIFIIKYTLYLFFDPISVVTFMLTYALPLTLGSVVVFIGYCILFINISTIKRCVNNTILKIKSYIYKHYKLLLVCFFFLLASSVVYSQWYTLGFHDLYLRGRYFFFCYYYTIPFISSFIFFFNNSVLLRKSDGTRSISFQTEVLVWNLNCWYFVNFFITILYFFLYIVVNYEYNLVINNPSFFSLVEIYNTTYQYNMFTRHASFNILGISVLLLSYLISMSCLVYLAEHGLLEKPIAPIYFMLFIGFTTALVTTTNLLVLVIAFELIFLPSLAFAYFSGYAGKSAKAVTYLTIWTLFGSFLVLSLVIYLYNICGTLNYAELRTFKFSTWEYTVVYFLIIVGFGIKIPVFPAHYWLTKVHVEASGGFSMFLSGFLVKTAIYCFYIMHLLFYTKVWTYFIIIVAILGILESSLKMWVQSDLKKLVAYATIQEMNMILLSLVLFQASNLGIIAIFTLMHGTLSALLFFIVDIINKRTRTRNIHNLSGVSTLFPQLSVFTWLSLLNFFGFPFTIKFFLEWQLLALLLSYFGVFAAITFAFILFLGNVGFAKAWFSLLYGTPNINLRQLSFSTDLSSSEKKTISFFSSCLSLYILLIFFF